ncbi:MAG: hypothetical protein WC707_03645 [Candidatus Babeliaceae bacterium]|jgi:hypothetical protein
MARTVIKKTAHRRKKTATATKAKKHAHKKHTTAKKRTSTTSKIRHFFGL